MYSRRWPKQVQWHETILGRSPLVYDQKFDRPVPPDSAPLFKNTSGQSHEIIRKNPG
jgi:hypothetical protein